MCPDVPETKAGCSVWLVYKYGQRVLVKRLYVSAKLIKQTNCCEKLSDLPSFPRAGALLRSTAPCKLHYIEPVQMGPINPDYAELHFIGVCRLLLSSQRVAARLPTGSPGLLFSDWFPTAVHLLHTTTNIPSFSDASFFAAWMGRVMRQPPRD